MRKLPTTFKLSRYGLDVRLVCVDDAEFILSVRTSKRGEQMLSHTDTSLSLQREWIQEYKKRESNGVEYYLIYFYQGSPVGVNRIYNIDWQYNYCTTGSWAVKKDVDFDVSIKTMLILREIVFETLELDISFGETRKTNKQMQRLYKMLGVDQIGETEDQYLYKSMKSKYEYGNEKIKRLIGLL